MDRRNFLKSILAGMVACLIPKFKFSCCVPVNGNTTRPARAAGKTRMASALAYWESVKDMEDELSMEEASCWEWPYDPFLYGFGPSGDCLCFPGLDVMITTGIERNEPL